MTVEEAVGFLKPVSKHQGFVAKDRSRLPCRYELPLIQKNDSGTQREDHLQIMAGDEFCRLQRTAKSHELPPTPGIEVTGRFVEQKHIRLARQHTRQADAPLLPKAQMMGHAIFIPS